jgi:hypothetical protein
MWLSASQEMSTDKRLQSPVDMFSQKLTLPTPCPWLDCLHKRQDRTGSDGVME